MGSIGRVHHDLASIAPEVGIDLLTSDDVVAALQRIALAMPRVRQCPLPPSVLMWLALALPLFRADSIPNVFAKLVARARAKRTWISLRSVTDGALAHGRGRLGVEPVKGLFLDVASHVDPPPSFHGRRVFAMDGSVISVPDTQANVARFGRHRASAGRSAFPQLRLVNLTATRTHEIRAACWLPYHEGERAAVLELIQHLRKGDLVLLDRGFQAVWIFDALTARGIDYVARVRNNLRPRSVVQRAPGDFDVEIRSTRKQDNRDGHRLRISSRMIEYRVDGGERIRLLTSIGDREIDAREFAVEYHERWEVELGYDEIKTHFASVRHGTLHLPLRGRSPDLVEQDLWAMLTTYNLVRRTITEAARMRHIDPRRISFTDALVVITATWQAGGLESGDRVRVLLRLATDIADCAMRRWRRPRQAPRVVRLKTKNYPRKRASHKSRRFEPRLRIGA